MSEVTTKLNAFLEPRGGRVRLIGEVKYLDGAEKPTLFQGTFNLEKFGGVVLQTGEQKGKTLLPSSVIKTVGTMLERGQKIRISWRREPPKYKITEIK